MTLEHAYYVSQIVAAAAVIVSLLYLATQIKQSNKQSRAQTHQAMMEWALARGLVGPDGRAVIDDIVQRYHDIQPISDFYDFAPKDH